MDKSIFEFTDFRSYLSHWIESRPKRGWGEGQRISKAIGLSTTMISQVLKGQKTLSSEVAADLGEYLGLPERDLDYWLLLVEHDRAGTAKLKKHYEKRMLSAQKSAAVLANRMKKDKELSIETKSIFYSSWVYSGVRNLTSLDDMNDVSAIANRLKLPRAIVASVVEYLVENGLCVKDENGLRYGPSWTHVEAGSPFVRKHHQNWRLRSIEKMDHLATQDLFFTGPLSLSEEAAREIREKHLPTFIERMQKLIGPSPSETVRCLNIDWFEY